MPISWPEVQSVEVSRPSQAGKPDEAPFHRGCALRRGCFNWVTGRKVPRRTDLAPRAWPHSTPVLGFRSVRSAIVACDLGTMTDHASRRARCRGPQGRLPSLDAFWHRDHPNPKRRIASSRRRSAHTPYSSSECNTHVAQYRIHAAFTSSASDHDARFDTLPLPKVELRSSTSCRECGHWSTELRWPEPRHRSAAAALHTAPLPSSASAPTLRVDEARGSALSRYGRVQTAHSVSPTGYCTVSTGMLARTATEAGECCRFGP